MTIHLDSEIVATTFDPVHQVCTYTIQRGDDRWTVSIPLAALDKLGPATVPANKQARQKLLANTLNMAMAGLPDAVPVTQSAEEV